MEGPWDLSARYSSTGVQWTAQSWSSRLSHCYSSALSQWDVFFPTMRNKFKSQYSYYWSGTRHTCLISVPMVLESIADCVSCCVQNSHPFNKTVSTPSTPPGNHNCQFTKKNPQNFRPFEHLCLRKGISNLVPSFCLIQSHILIKLSELCKALSILLPVFIC